MMLVYSDNNTEAVCGEIGCFAHGAGWKTAGCGTVFWQKTGISLEFDFSITERKTYYGKRNGQAERPER